MHFLIIGHLDGADPDWEIGEGASAALAVETFVRHAYANDVDDASFDEGEPTLDRIVQHWRNGEDMEDINLSAIYIDHVFTSESRIRAENASSFPGGIES